MNLFIQENFWKVKNAENRRYAEWSILFWVNVTEITFQQ